MRGRDVKDAADKSGAGSTDTAAAGFDLLRGAPADWMVDPGIVFGKPKRSGSCKIERINNTNLSTAAL
jgi:hypothetical protein